MSHLPRLIIDAPLFCQHCGARHVDESRNGEKWHRRAHTTHRCQSCSQDFDVYVSGQASEPKPTSEEKPPVFQMSDKIGIWYEADLDRLTAALALPLNTRGADIADAVRQLTRRCEELEHKLIALQDSHKMEPKH